MADDVLLGPDAALEVVLERLRTQLPVELALLEDRRGRPVPLPEPGDPDLWRPPPTIAGSDRAVLQPDDYPAILAVLQHTEEVRQVDIVDGGSVMVIPYVIRLWALVRHWDHETVTAARNRLALAILQTMLRSVQLGPDHRLRRKGWRTSYSDVGVDDTDQSTVSGWWGEFTIDARESLSPASLGTVDSIDTTTRPPHPALGPLT